MRSTSGSAVNYVLDLDIRSFFDKVDHDHLEKFIRHRIGDERFVRLILKMVKAGVMEDGQGYETKEGTPQGAVISPLLANLYLHYVLDLWVQAWRRKVAHGDVVVVRYADDAVLGFQNREEAEKFLAELPERVRKFGLELQPEKTRLIEFGRYAAERRRKRGEGKPETFNFRFVRKTRGWIRARAACQVSDRGRVRGSGRYGSRRIFSW
jgi:RNA-directed DNA polymerase